MAVPAEDERDYAFAMAYGLPIVRTVEPPADFEGGAYAGDGPHINSEFLDGLVDRRSQAEGDRLARRERDRRAERSSTGCGTG